MKAELCELPSIQESERKTKLHHLENCWQSMLISGLFKLACQYLRRKPYAHLEVSWSN